MGFKEIIKNSFLEGYASNYLEIGSVFICIICTAILSLYIYLIYKHLNKNTFYNRNFNLSLIIMAIITAAIILTIQSNIVISLGMVGALSIIRFRTAIKDPIDLGFLFWSISIGIICGAGFAIIAIIALLVLTIVIVLFCMLPDSKESLILVINATSYKEQDTILQIVNKNCQYVQIKAKNISKNGINLAIEIKVKTPNPLIEELMNLESVSTASLVEHNGEITV